MMEKLGVLDTTGIELLGKERPDLLIKICKDNFLPPSQMVCALKALEWYPNKQSLLDELDELLNSFCDAIASQAAITMGFKSNDNTTA